MTIERDQVLLDPLANSPLKIWEVQSRSIERLKEEDWEPKLRLTSTEEQVIESMETVLLLGRSGTGKTICIANEMQARIVRRSRHVAAFCRVLTSHLSLSPHDPKDSVQREQGPVGESGVVWELMLSCDRRRVDQLWCRHSHRFLLRKLL
jgi:hypothetical protein